jgi:hypothetical protein
MRWLDTRHRSAHPFPSNGRTASNPSNLVSTSARRFTRTNRLLAAKVGKCIVNVTFRRSESARQLDCCSSIQ